MRLRIILRNVLSNWASYAVTAIVGFLLAPLVVHSLGNTGYGLWTLIVSLTGYFGLLDLGIRSSVGRFVARYLALNDREQVNRTVSTAFGILAAGGALALLATVFVVIFLFGSFKIEPQYVADGRTALLLTGFNMACILPLGVFSAVLIALERFDVLSGAAIVIELLRAALVVTLLTLGYGVVALALTGLFLTLLQYTSMAVAAKKLLPELSLTFTYLHRPTFYSLLGFGIYRFIWIVANQLIFYSDSVVIGLLLGTSAITAFAIPVSLINYGRGIVSLVTDTLVPTAARLDAQQDLAGLRRLLIGGTMIALVVALPICIGYVFFGQQFLILWMGKPYAGSAVFLTVLTIPQLGSMSQYVAVLILAGMARHKILAYTVLVEGVLNLSISVYLVQKMGLIGVAWGTVIANLICTTVIVPVYTLRVLKLDAFEYFRKSYLRPILCSLPAALVAYLFSIRVHTPTWPIFAAEVTGVCAVFGLLVYLFCLDFEQRASVVAAVAGLFRREALAHGA